MDDYYQILGVSSNSSIEKIKERYRFLSQAFHPDKFARNPGFKDEAEANFKKINEAYQALSNPEQRSRYDSLRSDKTSRAKNTQRYGQKHTDSEHYWKERFEVEQHKREALENELRAKQADLVQFSHERVETERRWKGLIEAEKCKRDELENKLHTKKAEVEHLLWEREEVERRWKEYIEAEKHQREVLKNELNAKQTEVEKLEGAYERKIRFQKKVLLSTFIVLMLGIGGIMSIVMTQIGKTSVTTATSLPKLGKSVAQVSTATPSLTPTSSPTPLPTSTATPTPTITPTPIIYKSIETNYETLTQPEWQNYKDSLLGKRIRWIGTVKSVFWGSVTIDIGQSKWHRRVYLEEMSKDQLGKIKNGDTIEFEATIHTINWILGMNIWLNDVILLKY
ncbi:MAG: J domain-containing protein [Caldilineaceae bacterium]